MVVTTQELERFGKFAECKLASAAHELSWLELFQAWLAESTPAEQRKQLNAIILQGIADADAGRSRPVEQVTDELRAKFGLN